MLCDISPAFAQLTSDNEQARCGHGSSSLCYGQRRFLSRAHRFSSGSPAHLERHLDSSYLGPSLVLPKWYRTAGAVHVEQRAHPQIRTKDCPAGLLGEAVCNLQSGLANRNAPIVKSQETIGIASFT
jgi:hypothetical protein